MQQLECGHPQDVDDFGIEPGDRPFRDGCDEVVECATPAERPSGDLGGERAIALV
jgi:hypothetical protein